MEWNSTFKTPSPKSIRLALKSRLMIVFEDFNIERLMDFLLWINDMGFSFINFIRTYIQF